MSLYGAFDSTKHFSELATPLVSQGEGVIAAATRRVTALRNLLGNDSITLAQVIGLTGTPGTVVAGKPVIAAEADSTVAVLNFSNLVLADGARILRAAGVAFEAVTGWMAFTGETTTGARYSAYFEPTNTGDASLLGLGNTGILADGASSNTAQAAQLHIIVQSGATVTTRGGDATAGIHPVWAKVVGDVGSIWNSGHRIAPIWSDIQVNGSDVSAQESFAFLASAGGSSIRSLIRWEGSANATKFLETEKAAGNGFMVTTGYEDTQGATPAAWLVADLGGTLYGIPCMAVA